VHIVKQSAQIALDSAAAARITELVSALPSVRAS